VGELDDPVVVELPLRGEWTVERTPADRIPSHGTDVLGQRYAYDFVRTDDRPGLRVHPAGRLRWLLVGGRTRDAYGWGQPVHAATDGEVVAVVDGVPERTWLHVVRETRAVLRTTRRFRSDPSFDPTTLAGNYVITRRAADGVCALYAHLVPGSVAVAEGQRVAAGEVLGRVGHSGNSTAPHLHFQLMDSSEARRARGVPCAFAAYDLRRSGGRWEPVHDAIPGLNDRIRLVPEP
jgi:hypothetical protein